MVARAWKIATHRLSYVTFLILLIKSARKYSRSADGGDSSRFLVTG